MSAIQMSLGLFVWGLNSAAYQSLQRTTAYRYGRNNRIGKRAASQFIGPGTDTITLQGWIHFEMHNMTSLDQLRTMAARGEPYVMVSALGEVFGLWEIDEIAETQTLHLPNGKPRKIEFTVALTRVDDDRIDEVGLITDIQALL